MADIVRGIGFGDWNVRVFDDGVPRVSGTEIGRRLQYDVANPTAFNRVKVAPWLKQGKFNDSDIKVEPLQCKKGFGHVEVLEYWPTLDAALRMAMLMQTDAAKDVHQRVVDHLQSMIAKAALPAFTDLASAANDALVTNAEPALVERAELFAKLVLSTIEEGLVAPMDQVLEPLAKLVERVHGLYIDEDRRLFLNYQARILVRTLADILKKTSVTEIWDGVREVNRFPPGKTFSTVTRDKFDKVHRSLVEQIKDATKAAERMRAEKEQSEKEELARSARKRLEAEKRKASNVVVRPRVWRKR